MGGGGGGGWGGQLQALHVADNGLGPAAVEIRAGGLRHVPSLTVLDCG